MKITITYGVPPMRPLDRLRAQLVDQREGIDRLIECIDYALSRDAELAKTQDQLYKTEVRLEDTLEILRQSVERQTSGKTYINEPLIQVITSRGLWSYGPTGVKQLE